MSSQESIAMNFFPDITDAFSDVHGMMPSYDTSLQTGDYILSLGDFGQREPIANYTNANSDSDYFSSSSSETLQDLTSFQYCQQIPDDDDSSVMLDEMNFLNDVDNDEEFISNTNNRHDQCETVPLFNGHRFAIPSSDPRMPWQGETCRQFYQVCDTGYSMSPSYENTPQQSMMMSNLPNLPDFDMNDSPGSSGDDDTGSESDSETTARKGKRGSKSILLWKFLLDSLSDPQYTPEILRWENKESGIFKFVDTGAVARLWGKQKRKQDMNFEKLSRGIRHYYKAGMMSRVSNKRLYYKFNWKKVPREYRRR